MDQKSHRSGSRRRSGHGNGHGHGHGHGHGNRRSQPVERKDDSKKSVDFKNRSSQGFFPPPTILQEYEYAQEGAANRIIDLIEAEQRRRNEWEDEYMEFHKKSVRLGQIFGFTALIIMIFTIAYLSSIGKENVAITLAVSGFLSFALANLFSFVGKKMSRRPRVPYKTRIKNKRSNDN